MSRAVDEFLVVLVPGHTKSLFKRLGKHNIKSTVLQTAISDDNNVITCERAKETNRLSGQATRCIQLFHYLQARVTVPHFDRHTDLRGGPMGLVIQSCVLFGLMLACDGWIWHKRRQVVNISYSPYQTIVPILRKHVVLVRNLHVITKRSSSSQPCTRECVASASSASVSSGGNTVGNLHSDGDTVVGSEVEQQWLG